VKNSSKRFFPGRLAAAGRRGRDPAKLHFKAVKADHVRLILRTNMCTGFGGYRDRDADPTNDGDCRATVLGHEVTAAELQVYSPDHKKASVTKVVRKTHKKSRTGATPVR